MVIYSVDTYMVNPKREYHDLHVDYDNAMNYFNGVSRNPDCESIEVMKLETTKECSIFKVTEIVASYSKETNTNECI